MTEPPRVVNTPEKAALYANKLMRDATKLERMFTGTAIYEPLAAYFDALPETAQDELMLRFRNLNDRIETFIAARSGGVCPVCGHVERNAELQVQHMKAKHPEVIEQRLTDAGFVKGEDGVWIDTKASDD